MDPQTLPLAVGIAEAARLLAVSASQIRKLIADGTLPIVRYPSHRREGVGSRRVLIAMADLTEFVRLHRIVQPEPNRQLSRQAILTEPWKFRRQAAGEGRS